MVSSATTKPSDLNNNYGEEKFRRGDKIMTTKDVMAFQSVSHHEAFSSNDCLNILLPAVFYNSKEKQANFQVPAYKKKTCNNKSLLFIAFTSSPSLQVIAMKKNSDFAAFCYEKRLAYKSLASKISSR